MSEHHFRPRLVRHMHPSSTGSNTHYYSNTLPLMLASTSNRIAIASSGVLSQSAVNDNMAFDDRTSLDSFGQPHSASSPPTPIAHCSPKHHHNHYPASVHQHNNSYNHAHQKTPLGSSRDSDEFSYPLSSSCTGHHKQHSTAASDRAYDQVVFDILKIEADHFAKQISLIELVYFKAIQPEEFLSFKWNGKDKLEHAPNIVASTKWFNQINFWVQHEILNVPQVNKRAEVLAHFIKIAKKLIDLNNLYSAMAIVSALQVECIYRLKQTWAALSNKDRTSYRRLDDLFNQEDNYRRLREHTTAMKLPCIPYLGIYLSDLTYINVAHPSQGEMEPQNRLDKINNILRVITDFQQSDYQFARLDYIYRYLKSQQYIEELQKFLEDDNYKLSKKREPDENCNSTISSKSCALASGGGPVSMTLTPGLSKSVGMEPKWSLPIWGDSCSRLVERSYSVSSSGGCKHAADDRNPGTDSLPQPLLKVSLPTHFTSSLPPPAYPSGSLLKHALQNHKMSGSGVAQHSGRSDSNGDWASVHSTEAGHKKPLSSASFHIGSSGPSVNRSASLCYRDSDNLLPQLHLLDDSLLDAPVHRSATQSTLPGRPFTRRPTDISDLSLAAVAAVAKDALVASEAGGDETLSNPGANVLTGSPDTARATSLATVAGASSGDSTLTTPTASTGESKAAGLWQPGAHDSQVTASPSAGSSSLRMVCYGCLQRKSLMKRGTKCRFPLWHRYWLVLLESPDNLFLVYFEPNSLRAVRREEFRTKESQVQSLRGFLIVRKEPSPSSSASKPSPASFRLIDPQQGTTYKFRGLPNSQILLHTDTSGSSSSSHPGSERSSTSSHDSLLRYQTSQWYDVLSGCLRRLERDQTDADLIQLTDS